VQQNARMDRELPQVVLLETILIRWFNVEGAKLASHDAARHALLKWSDEFPGALVSEVTPASLRAFVKGMADRGLSDGYIRRTLSVGKRALNWAHQEGLLERVPFVKLPAEGEGRSRAMTLEEMALFMRAAIVEPVHVRLYLALAIGTAARPSSILGLQTWQQLDFERDVIHLNPPGRKQNKKHRPSIPMAAFLRPLLLNLTPGHVIQFNGKPLKSIRMAIERVRERAGMPEISAYTLRHTVATELRGRGVEPWALAGFLGHSTGYRTTENYAKNRPEHLRGVVRAVEAYWSDLGALLGGGHLGPFVNQEQRSSCVLPSQALKSVKPLRNLVEPDGIEPSTSTMPL